MKLSRFFEDLTSVYNAEIEDLKSDSEGKNILKTRLREKAEQLPLLLPMMGSNPEMLASAFHSGFIFMNPLVMETLSTKEESKLPTWKSLSTAVKLEPWAEPLSKIVLNAEGGERFMVIAAALEYLNRGQQARKHSSTNTLEDDEDSEANEEAEELKENGDLDGNYGRHGRDDGDDGDDYDLDEAGADWLAEQGFDRKD
ncbi:hypothetical protein ACO0KY_06435 [Undibacterium sp. Dicai25W]|uniref:hypothetical protein n=1 Tax=Undibacterium sp. Dicai25W TaxID=3413034 RepID=UPI003BF330F3